MNCLECRGACCEEIILSAPSPEDDYSHEWFAARAKPIVAGVDDHIVAYAFDSRCRLLTKDGLCEVHSNGKPQVCVEAVPGAADCLGSIRRRRTPEQEARISEKAA